MITRFINELKERDRILFITGAVHLLFFAGAFTAAFVDPRIVLGENVWIKPIKFSLSIAAYVWTFGWFLAYLEWPAKKQRWVSGIISFTMFAEMLIIMAQVIRGVPSHFNNSSALDGILFGIMGLNIAANTGINIYIWWTFLYNQNIRSGYDLSPAFLTAVRLSIAIFIIGSLEGGAMLGIGKHTVGAADGGPGIALLHWSSVAGDLRIAHFFGLHSIQVIPLFIHWFEDRFPVWARPAAFIVSLCYFAGFNFFYFQAMAGLPLFGGGV